jgi:hypothetical protein
MHSRIIVTGLSSVSPFLVRWDQSMDFFKAPGRLERWKQFGVWWPYGAGERELEIDRARDKLIVLQEDRITEKVP